MKNKFIFCSLIVLAIACKKNTESEVEVESIPPGFSATINGVPAVFNDNVQVDTLHGSINISASQQASGSPLLTIYLFSPNQNPLTTGVYVNYNVDYKAPLQANLFYKTFFNYGSQGYLSADDSVKVIKLSSSSIIGTFKGKARRYERDINDPRIMIDSTISIEGKFNLKW